MSLVTLGDFRLHSGDRSFIRFNLDELDDTSLHALAEVAVKAVPPFSVVYGVPTGGERLAEIMRLFARADADRVLIVDDVSTTGESMDDARLQLTETLGIPVDAICGLVILHRGVQDLPIWVRALCVIPPEIAELMYRGEGDEC